jgi:zinc transport system substrate-binding protein
MTQFQLPFTVITMLALLTVVLPNLLAYASTNQTNLESLPNQSAILSETNTTSLEGSGKLNIVASFYPIYEFVKQVGGDKVSVSSLIPIGVEPHDFEPTIQQIQLSELDPTLGEFLMG